MVAIYSLPAHWQASIRPKLSVFFKKRQIKNRCFRGKSQFFALEKLFVDPKTPQQHLKRMFREFKTPGTFQKILMYTLGSLFLLPSKFASKRGPKGRTLGRLRGDGSSWGDPKLSYPGVNRAQLFKNDIFNRWQKMALQKKKNFGRSKKSLGTTGKKNIIFG